MSSLGRLLIIDDDPDVLLAAQLLLKQSAISVRTERDPRVIPSLLHQERFDVILLDMNFHREVSSGKEGFTWLEKIKEIDPDAVVVLITAYGDVEKAVRAIKSGASDFVLKPWQNEKLLATLSAAVSLRHSRKEVEQLRLRQDALASDLDRPFRGFIGKSAAMRKVFDTIAKVGPTDANVLILGENGTGKELVAREIHRHSKRRNEVFIAVDMGALPAGLFESELFGHVKGSFTDAREDRAGRFEIASGGTLFLDEIANLPLGLQPKLLSVLQNRSITRVGSNQTIPIDIRLVCASNMHLSDMAKQKEFREDLYYRIQTVEIHLPPLRERPDDVPLLLDYFLEIDCARYQKPLKSVSRQALGQLREYHWPGNVRELQHAVERAVIMSDTKVLEQADFLLGGKGKGGTLSVTDTMQLEEIEKSAIEKALRRHDGNITHTAKELGLTRAALYRRMEKHGL